jgi:hypothetical protein
VHRPLAEVVVDAKHVFLAESRVQNRVELARRCQVVTERLLHDDPRPLRASGSGELLDDGFEQRRRDREIMSRPLLACELFP